MHSIDETSVRHSKKQAQLSVLMVENDPDDFYLLSHMLQAAKKKLYTVSHASNLLECLELLRARRFDVILLDLGLGDSQGMNTLETVIKSGISVPTIVLTGIDNEELGEQAIKLGAEDYLPKAEVSPFMLSRAVNVAIERHRLLSELRRQATRDSLTGLYNRAALFDKLNFLIEHMERNNTHLAAAMVDLDGFKTINDTLGHRVGDDVIMQASNRLRQGLRRSDLAARYGGDEFVLLLTNYQSTHDVMEVMEKKHKILCQPMTVYHKSQYKRVTVGASVGVAEWHKGMTASELLSKADQAMYQTKHGGKNAISLGESSVRNF